MPAPKADQSTLSDYGGLAHGLHSPRLWTCPITGWVVPKRPQENEAWRSHVRARCKVDRKYALGVQNACRRSFLFWCNAFAFTYRQFESSGDGAKAMAEGSAVQPMITWPIQDAAAASILHALENQTELCIDKSRDMGASWLMLLVFIWLFLYRPDTALMLVSRKEDLVDKPGNPDCLFWKLDFILKHLPKWMVPNGIDRTHMHLSNPSIRSVIDGESTGENIGRGGRRYAIGFDEAAAIPQLRDAQMASGDTAFCRIYVSTPKGPGAYYDTRFSGIDVFIMGYWDHPEKGVGRELKFHPFFERVVWCSPWLEHQIIERKRSRKDLEQNAMCDHQGSGSMVFDIPVINMQLSMAASRKPYVGALVYDTANAPKGLDRLEAIKQARVDLFKFVPDSRGKLRLWCEMKQGRPRQDHPYAMGIDISTGVAASNSVISVGNAELKLKWAEYASGTDSPDELAAMAAMLGHWFGGPAKRAFISFENNGGQGKRFGEVLRKRLGYPWIDRHRHDGRVSSGTTDVLGWTSTNEGKQTILQELRGDMAAGRFTNFSVEALQEASQYVYFETSSGGQSIGPARMQEESQDAWKTHGDRVIADAILNRAMKRMAKIKPDRFEAPRGSAEWAFRQGQEEEEE